MVVNVSTELRRGCVADKQTRISQAKVFAAANDNLMLFCLKHTVNK